MLFWILQKGSRLLDGKENGCDGLDRMYRLMTYEKQSVGGQAFDFFLHGEGVLHERENPIDPQFHIGILAATDSQNSHLVLS